MAAEDIVRDENSGAWIHKPTGRILVSVTQAIEDAGLSCVSSAPPIALRRGTSAHKAIADLLTGKLQEIPNPILPYIEAFVRFLETGVSIEAESVEERRANLSLGLVGQPDFVGTVNGEPAIIDFKSGSHRFWYPIQTAGYSLLIDRPEIARYSLLLRRDSEPRLVRHSDPNDIQVFMAALTISHFRRKNNGQRTHPAGHVSGGQTGQ